jgi:hypothetical protein
MKTNKWLFIVISFLMFSAGQYGAAQGSKTKQSRKETRKVKRLNDYNEVKELIETKDFVFNAQRAFPTGMRSIDLTTNTGSISVKNDSVNADLPYFGRSYVSNYSGDAGINFEGRLKKENIEVNDKKLRLIYSFTVTDSQDQYDVSITATSPENVSVSVISRNKASISYSGELVRVGEEKNK